MLDKNSSEKTALLHRGEKVKENQKNKQTLVMTAYYDGAGEHPKAGKQKRKAKQKEDFFIHFFSFDQLSTHFVVLSENLR